MTAEQRIHRGCLLIKGVILAGALLGAALGISLASLLNPEES